MANIRSALELGAVARSLVEAADHLADRGLVLAVRVRVGALSGSAMMPCTPRG